MQQSEGTSHQASKPFSSPGICPSGFLLLGAECYFLGPWVPSREALPWKLYLCLVRSEIFSSAYLCLFSMLNGNCDANVLADSLARQGIEREGLFCNYSLFVRRPIFSS